MGFTIDEMTIGQSASFAKTITEADVYMFAGISGDMNPVHINEEYAKDTMFKKRIVHGILGVSLISTVFGMYLPGPGSIYMNQNVTFKAPVYLGDTIKAICTVKEKIEDKNRVVMESVVLNQSDVVVIAGEAMLMPPKK